MAVTKLWKVSVRLGQVLDYTTNPEKTANPEYSAEDYQALKDVLAYAKDEEKTEHEFFCDGINCNVAMARDQFITVKEQFGKTDGIQAYLGYLSFKENVGQAVSGGRYYPSEHETSPLPFCHQLRFLCRWEAAERQRKVLVLLPPYRR